MTIYLPGLPPLFESRATFGRGVISGPTSPMTVIVQSSHAWPDLDSDHLELLTGPSEGNALLPAMCLTR